MPRHARFYSSTGIYHITQRGTDRKIIFDDDHDYMKFLHVLHKTKTECDFSLYAYCLMNNHFHLLLKQGTDPLELIFKKLCCSYVYYFNQKYDLHGHLFQDRFHSEIVENDEYFLSVLRYIFQNPVKAGLCDNPENYKWLGCSGITDNNGLLDPIKDYTDLCGEHLKAFVNSPCTLSHIDETCGKRLTDTEAIDRICKSCGCSHVREINRWGSDRIQNAIVLGIKAGVSIRQMSRITGIDRKKITNIIRNQK